MAKIGHKILATFFFFSSFSSADSGFLVEKEGCYILFSRPSHKSSRNDWMGYDHHQYVAAAECTLQVLLQNVCKLKLSVDI